MAQAPDLTQLLKKAGSGDVDAEAHLLRVVHDELKRMAAARMAGERPGHTLQTTALVNEAYLRLLGKDDRNDGVGGEGNTRSADSTDVEDSAVWKSRRHFFAATAESMRRILVDNARRRKRLKRGGDRQQVSMEVAQPSIESPDVDLLALDEALEKLESQHPEHAAVVKLRYFAGMTIDQTSDALGISTATVKRHWSYARVWLKREIGE